MSEYTIITIPATPSIRDRIKSEIAGLSRMGKLFKLRQMVNKPIDGINYKMYEQFYERIVVLELLRKLTGESNGN